jgi:hypothetical protein
VSRALTDAVIARLKAELEPRVTVYDGGVPPTPSNPRLPYVVAYPDNAPASRDRLAAVTGLVRLGVQLTSVGVTRVNAQAVADAARAALLDQWLPVPGWRPGPVGLDESFTAPVRQDDTVTPPVFYAIDQYLVTAVPA